MTLYLKRNKLLTMALLQEKKTTFTLLFKEKTSDHYCKNCLISENSKNETLMMTGFQCQAFFFFFGLHYFEYLMTGTEVASSPVTGHF